jgi:hypothetical protein
MTVANIGCREAATGLDLFALTNPQPKWHTPVRLALQPAGPGGHGTTPLKYEGE